jgi:hypothetical protein
LGVVQRIQKEEECSEIEKREEPDPYGERGGGLRKNRKDSQRPSHGTQDGPEPDLDARSECLRTEK